MSNDEKNIEEILSRGVINIIPEKNKLKNLLLSEKNLNVYLGIDPTATRIHIGNAVPLRKIQLLSELGHNVTFLIGDFTALIGDSSDKESERPTLAYQQIRDNFKTYKKQAEKILDYSKVKVKFNGEWLKKLNFEEVVKLTKHYSLGEFISRELIKKRLASGKKVGLHEVLYPVMQGYDSYFMNTDIQVGSADQTFNMQAGRILQKDLRKKESFVLVTDYLEGTDGRKMSKSWGNAIWIDDDPDEMYGKVMSIKDELIIQYFTLATNLEWEKVNEYAKRLKNSENPMDIKQKLAFQIVSELHNNEDAKKAALKFQTTFQKKKPTYRIVDTKYNSLAEFVGELVGSKSEAKRLINQKAVDVNENTQTNPSYNINSGDKIKIGSRNFVQIK